MDMDINISFLMMTADIISLMLLGTLYFSNKQRMSYDRDMEFIMRMMAITAISNVAGIVFHYFNLHSGLAPQTLVFLCGTWLFLGIVLFGYIWVKFLVTHMNIPFTAVRKRIYQAIILIACILLIINLFYPLIFSSSDGVYQRGPAYIVFFYLWLFTSWTAWFCM